MTTTPRLDLYRVQEIKIETAKAYLALIGKKSNATAEHYGSVNKVSVKTELHFQPYDGATNYHECVEFDLAVSRVIKNNFADIAAKAIDIMQRDLDVLKLDAKNELDRLIDKFTDAK